jgi:phosphatidylglycerophosphatase A
MSTIKKLLVTGLGTGYGPIAPGTWGSGAVALIWWLIALGSSGRQVCLTGSMLVLLVASGVVCIALGRFCQETFGKKDPSQCTIDEWAGQALAMLMLPLAGGVLESDVLRWTTAAFVSFVSFRVFDIIKPPPARQLEKLPYGAGVLLDDLMAGVYANLTAQAFLRLVLRMG